MSEKTEFIDITFNNVPELKSPLNYPLFQKTEDEKIALKEAKKKYKQKLIASHGK